MPTTSLGRGSVVAAGCCACRARQKKKGRKNKSLLLFFIRFVGIIIGISSVKGQNYRSYFFFNSLLVSCRYCEPYSTAGSRVLPFEKSFQELISMILSEPMLRFATFM